MDKNGWQSLILLHRQFAAFFWLTPELQNGNIVIIVGFSCQASLQASLRRTPMLSLNNFLSILCYVSGKSCLHLWPCQEPIYWGCGFFWGFFFPCFGNFIFFWSWARFPHFFLVFHDFSLVFHWFSFIFPHVFLVFQYFSLVFHNFLTFSSFSITFSFVFHHFPHFFIVFHYFFPCFPWLFLRFSLVFLHFSSLFHRFPLLFLSFS